MKQRSDEVIPGIGAISVGDPGTPVPKGWCRVLLTDVAKMESGHTPSRKHPEYWDGDIPWIGITDARLHHGATIKDTLQKVTEKGLENSAARWLPSNTVCLSRTASVGYVTVLGRPMATSQDFVNWICSTALEPEFLKYALMAEGDHIKRFGKGSTHTTIYFPEALAFHLNLPPLAEQHRIVAKIESLLAQVNAARDRLAKVPLILKRFRQAVLAAACSGKLTEEWRLQNKIHSPAIVADANIADLPTLPELPSGWSLVPLEAVVERFQYGTSEKANANASTGVPVLRMGNIQDGRLDLSDLKHITLSKQIREFILRPGDILFNRTNSPELVGKTAVFDQDAQMVFASYIIRAQVKLDLVRPTFVSWWLNSAWGRQWARQIRTDGVSQSNINATNLAAMPLPLPSLKEQDEAIRIGGQVLSFANSVARRVAPAHVMVERLSQAIFAKAFSGQLVPTEAELARAEGRAFESAEELLARVKAEREGAGEAPKRARRAAGGKTDATEEAKPKKRGRPPSKEARR